MRYGLKKTDVEDAAQYIMYRNAEAYPDQSVTVEPDVSGMWHHNLDGNGGKHWYSVNQIKSAARSWRRLEDTEAA